MKGSKNRMGLTKGSIFYTSTTVTYFMAILQFIDYSKFKRFSNIADEICTNSSPLATLQFLTDMILNFQ